MAPTRLRTIAGRTRRPARWPPLCRRGSRRRRGVMARTVVACSLRLQKARSRARRPARRRPPSDGSGRAGAPSAGCRGGAAVRRPTACPRPVLVAAESGGEPCVEGGRHRRPRPHPGVRRHPRREPRTSDPDQRLPGGRAGRCGAWPWRHPVRRLPRPPSTRAGVRADEPAQRLDQHSADGPPRRLRRPSGIARRTRRRAEAGPHPVGATPQPDRRRK